MKEKINENLIEDYEDWYLNIPEEYKIDINDFKIENNTDMNYEEWFKSLNSEDKIKAKYSEIFNKIKITEVINENIINNLFLNNDTIISEKILEGELNNIIKNNNKISREEINYFKEIIKKALSKVNKNFLLYNKYKDFSSEEKIAYKNKIKEDFNFKDEFELTIHPYYIEIILTQKDLEEKIGKNATGIKISFDDYHIINYSKEIDEDVEDIVQHEKRHIVYELYNDAKMPIFEFEKLIQEKEFSNKKHEKIFQKLIDKSYIAVQNETISYISNGLDKEIYCLKNIIYKYWDKFFNKLTEEDLSIENKEKIINFWKEKKTLLFETLENIEKYIFLTKKLYLKYNLENKSMFEFEAIIRNIPVNKYKRLCIFLDVNPDKFKEIYNQ
ncbi:hypothetical protein K9M42_02095 [Patescibacteria group bacterium]|nr:hypothetical protein [Patescibacteria group bacterium]